MQLVKFREPGSGRPRAGRLEAGKLTPLEPGARLCDLIRGVGSASELAAAGPALEVADVELLPPIDGQEVWGAGVTYLRSMEARIEESEQGGSFYDLVYRADRPELFLKATPNRVVGHGGKVRIRADTRWCVPEPELALVLGPDLEWLGCTIGNDMSARDIEGRNPLYLPQAKLYDACCAVGPGIVLRGDMPDPTNLEIALTIERAGRVVVEDRTSTSRMARRFEELIDWLGRDNTFPDGAILLTGTGLVPAEDFTLAAGDLIRIGIDGLGTLQCVAFGGPGD